MQPDSPQREMTGQQEYDLLLADLETNGPERMYRELLADGPPPPQPEDGAAGIRRWYEHQARFRPEFTELLEGSAETPDEWYVREHERLWPGTIRIGDGDEQ